MCKFKDELQPVKKHSFLGVNPPLKLQLRCRACKQAPFTLLRAVNKHIKACIQITRKANFPELHVTENPSAHTRGCVVADVAINF